MLPGSIKLLDHVDISHLQKTVEMPPKGKRNKVGKTVLSTNTEVEVPLVTTQGRTVRKARLKINSREWSFFVYH
jgi:hypothetical protein